MEARKERSGLHTGKGSCESSNVSVAARCLSLKWYEEYAS